MSSSVDSSARKEFLLDRLLDYIFDSLFEVHHDEIRHIQTVNSRLLLLGHTAPFMYQGKEFNPLDIPGTDTALLHDSLFESVDASLAEYKTLRTDSGYVKAFFSAILNRYDAQSDILLFIPESLHARAKSLMDLLVFPEDSEIVISDNQRLHLLRTHGKAIIIIKERLLDKLLL